MNKKQAPTNKQYPAVFLAHVFAEKCQTKVKIIPKQIKKIFIKYIHPLEDKPATRAKSIATQRA